MEWTDDGFVLAVRPHGETSAIASLLTRDHGRHPGLVRGGAGRRMRGILQPGNQVRATWRGRLAEHLGGYTVEPMQAYAADLDAIQKAIRNKLYFHRPTQVEWKPYCFQ